MANNPDRPDHLESYHEVPSYKYVFLFNTAIHKRFFKYWTTFLVVGMYVAIRIAALDYLLLSSLTHTVATHPLVFAAAAAVLLVIVYLNHRHTRRRPRTTITLPSPS